MSVEMKKIINSIMKNSLNVGIAMTAMILISGKGKLIGVFYLGLLVGVLNFILNGIILEKSIKSKSMILKIFLPLSYALRIIMVVGITIPFIREFKFVLAYMVGFLMYFPILFLSWRLIRMEVR